MGWAGRLDLHYRRDDRGGTTAHDRHEGPLRVLQRLYPEGPQVCHHVLVHPPGGIVGGDVLEIDALLDEGTHALITTPGATRFYRSAGDTARQAARLRLAAGARCEWLPLEAIAYSGCRALNALRFELEPGAQMIGWDVVALGLPAAGQAFEDGVFEQCLDWPGAWRERGRIAADDRRLLDSPLGLGGHRVLATAWFAGGTAWPEPMRDRLLELARDAAGASPLARLAGSTSPQPGLVVTRALADRVEPAMALLQAVRAAWREAAWSLPAHPPRVWRT